MSNLFCNKTSNGSISIGSFKDIPWRKISRIQLFLNSKNNFIYKFENYYFLINFNVSDETIIAKELNNVISFIEKSCNQNICLSNDLKSLIDVSKEKEEKNKLERQSLIKLKSSNIQNLAEFNSYKDFCDKSLSCKLKDYQYKASFYLGKGNGGFDFSVPGSGKTIISYSYYNFAKNNKTIDYILIIGPISAYNAWHDEYKTVFGRNPDFISLADEKTNDAKVYLLTSLSNHKEITFINYRKSAILQNAIISFLKGKKCLLVIDEGHNVKNPDAATTKAVLNISKYATSRIILTGTPMPNGYEDLSSLFYIYSPYEKIIPFSYNELRRFSKGKITESQQKLIMNSIRPFYSRISKKYLLQTKQLPSPVFKIINCGFSPEQKSIYDFLDKSSINVLDKYESAFSVSLMKAILIRKMQISSNPGLLTKGLLKTVDEYSESFAEEFGIPKSINDTMLIADKLLMSKLKDNLIFKTIVNFAHNNLSVPKNEKAVELALHLISEGKKVILWEVFVDNMYVLKEMIQKKTDKKVEIVNGSVCGNERHTAIKNFKDGDSMILIANPATLSESISLHKCCQNAIYVNRNFNAAHFIQSKDRIHRINMPLGTTATYYILVNDESIDLRVNDRLNLKENRMLKILDDDDIPIGGIEFDDNSFISDDDARSCINK